MFSGCKKNRSDKVRTRQIISKNLIFKVVASCEFDGARDLIEANGAFAQVYFISFVTINGMFIMNILIAILFENYAESQELQLEKEEKVNISIIVVCRFFVGGRPICF